MIAQDNPTEFDGATKSGGEREPIYTDLLVIFWSAYAKFLHPVPQCAWIKAERLCCASLPLDLPMSFAEPLENNFSLYFFEGFCFSE